MAAQVLIIDDEDLFREDLADLLRAEGYECLTAATGEEGLEHIAKTGPEVVLCDINLPGKMGIQILDEIMGISPESFVIMITAYGSLESSVDAFRKGASDYITKPLVVEDVLAKIARLIKYKRLSQEVKHLRREVSHDFEGLLGVGESKAMKDALNLIRKVSPTNTTVLITGESGTGKELVARAIHELSTYEAEKSGESNGERLFIAVNCAGIPAELLESELFGHVRGAFTGAIENHVGSFELAGEGTILLDEIAEMPVSLQSKLLRVLEQKEFSRLGDNRLIPLKARIIAATNKNLRDLVKTGEFREELFFRVAVLGIHVPPLCERRSDIPLLVEHFIKGFNDEMKRKCLGMESEAMRRLLSYSWPGNIRELKNVIERAIILSEESYLTLADLPAEIRGISPWPQQCDDLRTATKAFEREHIRSVLKACEWNKEAAAQRLKVNPSTLYRKMADLGLPTGPSPSGT
ncbi:MAG: sigma-54-dependent Fis family transcriptional regulator [Candidatus Hydrogenedentes bacterium]|nr:sigma-54-dependent Fis family transcriptional regulator [Candidatus Hydrogenedentota bacterium]